VDDLKCTKCGGEMYATTIQLDYMQWEPAIKCSICCREVTLAMLENRINFAEIKKEAEADLERISKYYRDDRVKRKRKKSDEDDDEDF
jgi:hypothetical protein